MAIDWNAIATIASPVVGVVAGIYINRWFENRPKLIGYYGHVGTHRVSPPNQPQFLVYTHNIVLRNAGRLPATNVRLMHVALPEFHIFPPVQHAVEKTPGGSVDLLIPRLVPGEEITVSYLYFPPLTAGEVNAGIKCDQGFAKQIPVLLQRQSPTWWRRTIQALGVVGAVTLLYVLYLTASWALTKVG